MEVLFRESEGTVASIRDGMPDPPSLNAVRTLIQILEEKGHLSRRKSGREFIYSPKTNRRSVGIDALRRVINTFFQGSVDEALAAHLASRDTQIDQETWARLNALIEETQREEEKP
ncbi:MAG: BlaI/MecI/CopY family transcriptional regulator [Verrucomicrobiae bacterium]|nr:BlaI/MecI/CopY family transcriptional regulator [Verrucomicrobiae bacterium]